MNEQEIKLVNRTARSAGAVGRNAVVPRVVTKYLKDNPELATVLDYGAGPDQIHVMKMRKEFPMGLILGYEIGDNHRKYHHITRRTAYRILWDVVYASNVLNVQPTEDALEDTLRELMVLSKNGIAIFNYPASPRKTSTSLAMLVQMCSLLWDKVEVKDKVIFAS